MTVRWTVRAATGIAAAICREATEGLQNCRFYRKFSSKRNIFNPSVTAPPCHLPLHKGGFGAYHVDQQLDKREFEDEEKERGKAGRIHCGVGSVEGREDDLFADLLNKDI